MKKFNFFSEHPEYRYAVLDFFCQKSFYYCGELATAYAQVHPAALNLLVEKEFHPDDAALSAYLFNTVNIHRLQLMKLQQENIALRNELQKYQTAQ